MKLRVVLAPVALYKPPTAVGLERIDVWTTTTAVPEANIGPCRRADDDVVHYKPEGYQCEQAAGAMERALRCR